MMQLTLMLALDTKPSMIRMVQWDEDEWIITHTDTLVHLMLNNTFWLVQTRRKMLHTFNVTHNGGTIRYQSSQ